MLALTRELEVFQRNQNLSLQITSSFGYTTFEEVSLSRVRRQPQNLLGLVTDSHIHGYPLFDIAVS